MKVLRGTVAVAVLDDGSAAAEDILSRIDGVFPSLYRVTHRDIEPTTATVVRVSRRKLGLPAMLQIMRDEGVPTGFVRLGAEPTRFLADYVMAAYRHLADGFPGFMLVSCRQGLADHRRVAIVADVRKPITTGTLLMAGVGMAHRTGGKLDILVLGLPPDAEEAFTENPGSFFTIKEEAEMLTRAIERAREVGLQTRWIVLGSGKPDEELVLDAVREHGIDLVIDDLNPIDIGSRIGRLGRVTGQLSSGAGGTALSLLTDAPCDVGIVVDAVHLRLISADRLGSLAGVALSLGLFAGPSAGEPSGGSTQTRITAEAPLSPGAGGDPISGPSSKSSSDADRRRED